MIDLCENWLEELRFNYNTIYVLNDIDDYYTSKDVEPLVINQGFRSYQVMLEMEKAGLNPSRTSNHMTGCAADIRCAGVEQAIRYMTILLDIADQKKQDFDELILERRPMRSQGDKPAGSVYWLHFAARPKNNRRKVLFLLE